MNDITNHEIAAVEKVNSTAFVKTVFRLYEEGKIVVLCEDTDNLETLSGLTISSREKPAKGGGWFGQKHAPI